MQDTLTFPFSHLVSESPSWILRSPCVTSLCISSVSEKLLRKENSSKASVVLRAHRPLQQPETKPWWWEAHSCRKPFTGDSLLVLGALPSHPRGCLGNQRFPQSSAWGQVCWGIWRQPQETLLTSLSHLPTNIDSPFSGLIRAHLPVTGILIDT